MRRKISTFSIEPSVENSKAVFTALARFGAPLEGLNPEDFAQPGNFFRMGTPPVMVDILPKINGVQFEQAWQRRVNVPVDSDLTVSFISREDLLAAKLAAGRPQDLADAAALNEYSQTGQAPAHGTNSLNMMDRAEQARKKGVADWLKLQARRRAEGGTPSLDERQAKAREDWRKLRDQGERAADTNYPSHTDDRARRAQTRNRGKDASDDTDH